MKKTDGTAEVFGPEALEKLREERKAAIQASMGRHPAKTGDLDWRAHGVEETRGRGIAGVIEDVRIAGAEESEEARALREGQELGGLLEKMMALTKDQRDVVRELWAQEEAETWEDDWNE